MRRILDTLLVVGLLASCSGGGPRVDRVVENGVEVVLNHVRPYRVPGVASTLTLEREFAIDAEDPALLAAGLGDIRRFAVDGAGSIYVVQRPRKDVLAIFKFDNRGRLERSFGRFGQGPGEIEQSSYFGINARNEPFNLDARRNRITRFSSAGEVIEEIPQPSRLMGAIPLDNGAFLVTEEGTSGDPGFNETIFSLFDRRFVKTRTMHSFRTPVQFPGEGVKIDALAPFPTGTFSADRMFLGISGPDYEIFVFNLDGNLLRKIRKDYQPVACTPAYRERALANLPQGSPVAGRLGFPDRLPAYHYLFADETGRLFVATSEKDAATGQNICDIFTPFGAFIGRAAVGYYDRFRVFWEGVSLDVVAKNGRVYMVREKDDGYKELVISKAVWR